MDFARDPRFAGAKPALDAASRARIEQTYDLPSSGIRADTTAWDDLISRAGSDDTPISVIEIDRLQDGARAGHDAFLTAMEVATEQAGGSLVATADILEPGVGDLAAYQAFAGGVAALLAFPSRAAYLTALLSDQWQAVREARRAAVADAIVLVAGENAITPSMSRLMGPPPSAADIPTPRIDGKSEQQIVDELLAIYPDGGADPTRAQLEVMMRFPRFREQPVHYINLYAFGDGSDTAAKGAAEHDAYNRAAWASVQAHGGRPLLRASVEHRLVSVIPWSRVLFVRWPSLAVFTDMRLTPDYIEAQKHRVASAETYGNFITIVRDT